MAEEFQESDIIFSESDRPEHNHGNNVQDFYFINKENMQKDLNALSCNNKSPNNIKKKKKMARSLPVKIQESGFRLAYSDEDYDGGEVVPPHVIVDRRNVAAGEMAFSVCSGNGRKLKGRYLSFFRNSVLRMTGFLET